MKANRLIAPTLAALATAGVLAATGVAQDDDSDSGPPPTQREAQQEREKARSEFHSRVANRLDVSRERLDDAVAKARRARLDADVEANRLTDAQRDAILACEEEPLTCDRSNLPAPRFERRLERDHENGERPSREQMEQRFEQMRERHESRQGEFYAAIAKELGKETDEVRRAFEAERPEGHGERMRFHRAPGGPEGDVMAAPGPPHGPGGGRIERFAIPAPPPGA